MLFRSINLCDAYTTAKNSQFKRFVPNRISFSGRLCLLRLTAIHRNFSKEIRFKQFLPELGDFDDWGRQVLYSRIYHVHDVAYRSIEFS